MYSILKYSLPFVSFIILGSVALREFTSIRYEVHNYKTRFGTKRRWSGDENDNDENDDLAVNDDKIIMEQLQSNNDKNDDWINIRGPRPWEDNREFENLKLRLDAKKSN
ncbi:Cytochrome c oxidase assembly protein COX16 -like protein [Sarcoptes scabiei]|nr:Cytochrome c oxidase assembly protein COX16 -like protein [Sarcoptes scabiei]